MGKSIQAEIKGWLPALAGQGNGNYCLVGMELLFGIVKKYWKWGVVMVAQHCE